MAQLKENIKETTILYTDTYVLAIVEKGQAYGTPNSTNIFKGELEDFKKQYPEIDTTYVEYFE